MIRKNNNKVINPDLIITADWHLREDTPICRTDDFCPAQWAKVMFVNDLQDKYNCPVFHAGDLFHHWKPSPFLLKTTMKYLPKQFHTIYGNHDLPQHSLENAEKCGIATLHQSKHLMAYKDGSWLTDKPYLTGFNGKQVGMMHVFTYKGKSPWPGCTAPDAYELLEKFSDFDLLITGDNHTPFTVNVGNRLLVNPGSLMRQDADQQEYKPAVWLWSAEQNIVEPVYLPINPNAVSRLHIEKIENKEKMLEAFISGLDKDWDISVSFKRNLKKFADANTIHPKIMEIIYEVTD